MPVSFFDTLPFELQQRSRLADRQLEEVEAQREARDARAPAEREALEDDWIGIGSKLGEAAEEARLRVLGQAPPADAAAQPIEPSAMRAEVRAQHAQARAVFEARRDAGLRHFGAQPAHCRVVEPVAIARATPAELAAMVRKRLERLGGSFPKHLRPSTRAAERAAHELVHFCRANELVDKEDYHAAIAEYSVALRLLPADPFALLNRGNCHKAIRLWERAAADYAAAIAALAPAAGARAQALLAYAHNNLGAVHHDQHDYVAAFAEYTTALSLFPACQIAWKNRAEIYFASTEPSPEPQRPPAQHKLVFSDCLASMDQDWHEEQPFSRGSVQFSVNVRKAHATYVAHVAVDLLRLPVGREPGGEA